MRRMDRYKQEENLATSTRLDKNQDLYHNLSSNSIYTNITDVTNANAFEIKSNQKIDNNSRTTREAYQQMQKYQNVEPKPRNKKELDDFNYIYQKKENKTYDINSFLEEARRNRGEKDEKDEKRKLKNNAYNILAGNNKEQLEKYREEKKNKIRTPEEDELHNLAEDILSKTLAGELDKETSVDLLSDLMATNMLDTVAGAIVEDKEDTEEEIIEEKDLDEDINDENVLEKENETRVLSEDTMAEFNKVIEDTQELDVRKKEKTGSNDFSARDQDFYTRSMDLSDKDFDLAAEFNGKKLPVIVKIFIALLIIAVIAVAAYFIYKRII